ncbi:MAG: hypothetical protein JSS87_09270 [Acidobacteria bacterium]|nr:hypothetical protein [Acidobacteriota bacterium]
MRTRTEQTCRFSLGLAMLLVTLPGAKSMVAQAPAAANAAFHTYAQKVEGRLAEQHRSANSFMGINAEKAARLRNGEVMIEQLKSSSTPDPDGAMLHHWRGTAFAAGATAADFERLMKDFRAYPQVYAPQVMQAKVLAEHGDHLQVRMRVKQQHVITVVMDMTYDIQFARLDAKHGYSVSRSTKIAEIQSPGARNERVLQEDEEHGFLWRLNTYWTYEERDNGLYMQIESVSLTRSIPTGLGWAVRPFIEIVPRGTLEFTLRSTQSALAKK